MDKIWQTAIVHNVSTTSQNYANSYNLTIQNITVWYIIQTK